MSARRRLFRLPWRTARQIRDDVDDELRFHLDMRVESLVAAGRSPEDARAAALREFGDVDEARRYLGALDGATEAAAQRRSAMHDLRQDLTYAVRALRAAPGFSIAVVAALALGVGAATGIFSIVNGVLLKPLPFPDPDRIVRLYQVNAKGNRESVSQPNFRDWQARSRAFSAMAIWGKQSATVQTPAGPVMAQFAMVSRDFFSVLDVQPTMGRGFVDDEARFGGRRAALISDAMWHERFGGTPRIIGTRFTTGVLSPNEEFEIVGVLPPGAAFPAGNEIWVPLELWPPFAGRSAQGWSVIARVKAGVSVDAARQDLSAVSRRLKQELGNETTMTDAMVVGLRDQIVGDVRPKLLVLLAASTLLLLIGLANATNLLMARLASRQGELAIRVALGATTWRLTRQVLVEAGVIVCIAGALGIGLAEAAVRYVAAEPASTLPRASDVGIDWPVLAFALLLSAGLALALGLVAAWRGARADVREAISATPRAMSGGRTSTRLRRGMVIAQLGLTVVLLVGATLIGRGFLRLLAVNPGFATTGVLVVEARPEIKDNAERLAYYDALVARAKALPGVVAAGAASGVPIAVSAADGAFLLLDSPSEPVTLGDWTRVDASKKGHAEYRIVNGDYFAAMGIPLLKGRLFAASDGIDRPHVAVVSAMLAARTWPNQDPIGKVVEYGNMDGDVRPFTVVGVVGDVRHDNLATEPTPTFYGFEPQRIGAHSLTLVVRATGDPAALITPIQRIVHDLRPEVAVRARTIDGVLAESLGDRRFTLAVIGAFAAVALLLSTLGVYSLVSYLVTQRTREIGIRVALGASRDAVLRLVVGEGLRLAFAGILAGLAASALLTRVLRGLVYGVSATDPLAYASVVVVLVIVAAIAAYVPGRRATRVDPMDVLRL